MPIKLSNLYSYTFFVYFILFIFNGVCFCPHFRLLMTSSLGLGLGARSSICSVLRSSCTSILRISAASSAVGEASGNSSAATLPLRGWRNCFSFSAKREMTDGPTYSVSAQLVHAPSRFDSPKVKECLFRLVCFSFISSRFSH